MPMEWRFNHTRTAFNLAYGEHSIGWRIGWGTLVKGVRLDFGWFPSAAYELGLVLAAGERGIEFRVKLLKFDCRLWAGTTNRKKD